MTASTSRAAGRPADGAAPAARGESRGTRVAVVGISISASCGVRDHATLLAEGLRGGGVACELHWLQRESGSLRGARAELAGFAQRVRAELERDPPDAILVHYSVFSYSYKGLPVFV